MTTTFFKLHWSFSPRKWYRFEKSSKREHLRIPCRIGSQCRFYPMTLSFLKLRFFWDTLYIYINIYIYIYVCVCMYIMFIYIYRVSHKKVYLRKLRVIGWNWHWKPILLGILRCSLIGLFSKRYHFLGVNDKWTSFQNRLSMPVSPYGPKFP